MMLYSFLRNLKIIILILALTCNVYGGTEDETLRPNAAGDETNLSKSGGGGDNYDRVDEVVSDDDGSYVSLAIVTWTRDLYNLDDSVGTGTINSVTVYAKGRESQSSGFAWLVTGIKTLGTIDDSTNLALTTSYADKSETFTTNPVTGNPWTWTEVDALQAGVRLRCETGYGDARCTQVWVVVDADPTVTFIPKVDIE